MKQIRFRIKGISPLLMHSDRLANPLDPATKAHKELTSKRSSDRTDGEHAEVAKSEWMNSIYLDDTLGPFLPGQNIDAALFGAGKLRKLGTKVKRSAIVIEDRVPLQYKGPRDAEGLYAAGFSDLRGIKIAKARVMRCRPKFNEWSAEFTVAFNEDDLNERQVITVITDAGGLVGLGDYRPRYGKFTVEVLNGK